MTIIGIAGGSGSGKTTFALMLQERVGRERCAILQQDAYYHDRSREFDHDGGSVNFDHPDAIDFALLSRHLEELKAGRPVAVPVYDYATHRRLERTVVLAACPWMVVEGMLVLADQRVRAICDTKVFIDAPEPLRFARRLARDARERGRDRAGVEQQFLAHVKPMHDQFVEPSRQYADKVYSGAGALHSSIRDLLVQIGGVL
ncbi:uridine kinase [uncultured Thiodictyon sp.]|jgi:uridine kinase|uniref:uridine kinase n=1 Tax=uncultured Thiodictyon sp. TaxID=1846217 RepID=UPI0025CD02A6|nr:uridine kinase [uncultured Thiodictyon sp.]